MKRYTLSLESINILYRQLIRSERYQEHDIISHNYRSWLKKINEENFHPDVAAKTCNIPLSYRGDNVRSIKFGNHFSASYRLNGTEVVILERPYNSFK